MKINEDERNLQLDRPGKGKTQEQMRKHTLDAGLNNKPIERAMHILSAGDDIQRISIVQNLPQLSSLDLNSTNNRVIPKIQHDLSVSSSEFQISTSQVFKTLFESGRNPNLLGTMLQGIDSKDPQVAGSWVDSLLAVVPKMKEEDLKNLLLPMAKNKSNANQTVNSKVFAGRLIGAICSYPKLKLIDCKKDLMPLVQSLCQDCSPDVRASICSNLHLVAQGIGSQSIKPNLLPSLIELACDDNVNVRSAAIVTISEILKSLDAETKKQAIVPLLKKVCDKCFAKNDGSVLVLAGEYGKILRGVAKNVPPGEVEYFLKTFKTLACRGRGTDSSAKDGSKDVVCRERCALNVPAIFEFTLKLNTNQLQYVYGIFRDLATDPCYLVRRSTSSGLAELSVLLGNQNKMIKNELVRLLRDDAVEVLEKLVPNISGTLTSFCQQGALSKDAASQVTSEIGKALYKCLTELSKAYNWRLTVQFLKQLESLPLSMPADFIHNNFTPALMDKTLYGKAKPIRIQALHTLIVFLRYNNNANQNKWLRESLIKQMAKSNNCYTRVLYLSCCDAVLDVFSEKYFKEFFMMPALQLSTDKISNVRYAFVVFAKSKMQFMVTLGADLKSKQLITDTLSKLDSSEKTRDVREALRAKRKDPGKREDRMAEEARRVQQESGGGAPKPSAAGAAAATTAPVPQRPAAHTPPKPLYIKLPLYMLSSGEIDDRVDLSISDDDKVKLRDRKRHSSIISTHCLDIRDGRKMRNRRSLHLGASRIPIKCTARLTDDCAKFDGPATDQKLEVRSKSVSNLPVYTRRPR